jgi:hypothetical protein
MGVSKSEIGYTSATTERGDHEVHKGHVVALGNNYVICTLINHLIVPNVLIDLVLDLTNL